LKGSQEAPGAVLGVFSCADLLPQRHINPNNGQRKRSGGADPMVPAYGLAEKKNPSEEGYNNWY